MPSSNANKADKKVIALVGHDNYGSREIFSQIYSENNSENVSFVLFISTGLYYNKSYLGSIWKLLKEASFIFCLLRFLEGLWFKVKGDTLYSRALKLSNVEVHFTNDINSQISKDILVSKKVDLLVSMFTMQILKAETIKLPPLGTIGTHPSILPAYRGLEVFFWMLANKETQAGVSVFFLNPKIDFGKVFMQEKFEIDTIETVESIYVKLTSISARLMALAVKSVLNNEALTFIEYNGKGSYFPMPTRAAFRKYLSSGHGWFGRPHEKGGNQ